LLKINENFNTLKREMIDAMKRDPEEEKNILKTINETLDAIKKDRA